MDLGQQLGALLRAKGAAATVNCTWSGIPPELQSEDSIGSDPLSHGQVWAISPGGHDKAVGLYRIEVNEGPGGGVHILNQPPPAPFRESVRIAEQNLYARASELVGDRNPCEHEFTVQLRSFDGARATGQTGVPALPGL